MEPKNVKKNKKKSKEFIFNLFLSLILITGVSLLFYPTVSNWWNNMHASRAIAGYTQAVQNTDAELVKQLLEDARLYNEQLVGNAGRFNPEEKDTELYNSLLDVSGTGIMGYVEIPSIKVNLPIYHGTDEAVLQIAAGHIEGSSLPIGGIGTHAAISGHCGLPSAKLFTNLSSLKEGDIFYIHVLTEILTYQVDNIGTVLPSDFSLLDIDPEQDYVTLITCTPYGVNSHRLMVRGTRIA